MPVFYRIVIDGSLNQEDSSTPYVTAHIDHPGHKAIYGKSEIAWTS